MRGVGLGLLLLVYVLVAQLLPDVPVGIDATIGTLLVFAFVLAVSRVGDEVFPAVLLLLGSILVAVVFDAAHEDLGATLPEAIACACAGALFARGMEAPALVVALPLVVAIIDGWSVASGGAPLTSGVGSSDALSLNVPAWGGGTALQIGIADPIFAVVFFWWAHRFGLRLRATAVALLVAAGLGVALVVAAEVTIPLLPLLAAAFYLPNLDRLARLARAPAAPA